VKTFAYDVKQSCDNNYDNMGCVVLYWYVGYIVSFIAAEERVLSYEAVTNKESKLASCTNLSWDLNLAVETRSLNKLFQPKYESEVCYC